MNSTAGVYVKAQSLQPPSRGITAQHQPGAHHAQVKRGGMHSPTCTTLVSGGRRNPLPAQNAKFLGRRRREKNNRKRKN